MLIMPYDIESQSRNVSCVPFRGRGPRSGEGIYEGKNDYDIRYGRDRRRRHYNTHCPLKGKRLTTFCASLALLPNVFAVHRFAQGAADWRSGPRWTILSVLCPRTPFPASRDFPSRGNERYEGKNSESYTSRTISAFPPPLWWLSPPKGGSMSYDIEN